MPLLRWRELAGAVYLEPDEGRHRALLRALLLLTPASARQVRFLLGDRKASGVLRGNAPVPRALHRLAPRARRE